MGPRQFTSVKSCHGVTIRFRYNIGDRSWITLERPGQRDRDIIDIPDAALEDVMNEFQSIGDSPERFNAFSAVLPKKRRRKAFRSACGLHLKKSIGRSPLRLAFLLIPFGIWEAESVGTGKAPATVL